MSTNSDLRFSKLTFADLKSEFRLTCDDLWGCALAWWFATAGEMNDRGLPIPSQWEYEPGPLGGINPDAYETPFCAYASDAALVKFGGLMFRYAQLLMSNGKSY